MRKALLLLAALFLLGTAALGEGAPGQMTVTTIFDGDTGMTVGRCVAPAGWQAAGVTQWCGPEQSAAHPARAIFTAMPQDGRFLMQYRSVTDYVQVVSATLNGQAYMTHQDGAFNAELMTNMLSLMSADGYADYMAASAFPDQEVIFRAQAEITPEDQAMMDKWANDLYENAKALLAGSQGVSVDGSYFGAVERTYALSVDGVPYLATLRCAVEATQMSITANVGFGTAVSATVSWDAPFVYLYAAPQAEYDLYADAFDQFCLNSRVSDEFTRASNAVCQQILGIGAASMSDAASTAKRGMSSVTDDSYNDEQYSDAILGQNDYTLADGDHVKISTKYDYVYGDDAGNVYYTASPSDEPAGMARLYPNQ